MSNRGLAAGFMQGFVQARQLKQDREEREQEKKARLKLFELQLAREQRAQAEADQQSKARQSFFDEASRRLLPSSGIVTKPGANLGVDIGDVDATLGAPSNLVELLSDPQMGLKALQAGIPLPAAPEMSFNEKVLTDPVLFERELMLRGAGGTHVNVGDGSFKTPPGYMLDPNNPTGAVVPIPGGPAATEITDKRNAATRGYMETKSALQALRDAAQGLKEDPNLWLGVGMGSYLSGIRGQPPANVAARIKTLQSKVAFSVLQAMREASKTGGALGQVSERELALLESNLAPLDVAQSPAAYRRALKDLIAYVDGASARLADAYIRTTGDSSAVSDPAALSDDELKRALGL